MPGDAEKGRHLGESSIRERQKVRRPPGRFPVPLIPGAGDVSRVIGSSLFQPPLTACRAPPFNSPFQSLRPPLLLSA